MGELYLATKEGKYEKLANIAEISLTDDSIGEYASGGIVRPTGLFRLDDECTFSVKLSKKDCERVRRAFGMKKPQLVGHRIAKRKNRLRRLNNWKKKAAERARFYNLPLAEKYRYLITHAVDTVTHGIIDTVQDCVGLIRGMEWGGYRNE